MRKLLTLVLLFAAVLMAQSARGIYSYEISAALAPGAQVVTVQIPTGTVVRNAKMDSAAVYCSVQCEITVERNGALATATAGTVRTITGNVTPIARVYRASNVGVGTVLSRLIVPAGATIIVDMADIGIFAGQNATVRTASITGTTILVVKWREY
jgi:hypothetical protein